MTLISFSIIPQAKKYLFLVIKFLRVGTMSFPQQVKSLEYNISF